MSIVVASWNVGNGSRDDLALILSVADVAGLQEMGDRDDLRAEARKHGFEVIDGNGRPGEASTPLLVRPGARIIRQVAWPLLTTRQERSFGRGAGPDMGKHKSAIGGLIDFGDQIAGVINEHLPASMQNDRREDRGHLMAQRTVRRLRGRWYPWLVTMDGNEDRDDHHDALSPFYAKYTNPHLQHDLPTHGRRAIDYVWIPRKRASIVAADTIETKSDHRALLVKVALKPAH